MLAADSEVIVSTGITCYHNVFDIYHLVLEKLALASLGLNSQFYLYVCATNPSKCRRSKKLARRLGAIYPKNAKLY